MGFHKKFRFLKPFFYKTLILKTPSLSKPFLYSKKRSYSIDNPPSKINLNPLSALFHPPFRVLPSPFPRYSIPLSVLFHPHFRFIQNLFPFYSTFPIFRIIPPPYFRIIPNPVSALWQKKRALLHF